VIGGSELEPPSAVQLPPTGADDQIWKLVQGGIGERGVGTVVHAVEVSGASPASAAHAIEQFMSEKKPTCGGGQVRPWGAEQEQGEHIAGGPEIPLRPSKVVE
jgi:hypothetical protein